MPVYAPTDAAGRNTIAERLHLQIMLFNERVAAIQLFLSSLSFASYILNFTLWMDPRSMHMPPSNTGLALVPLNPAGN